jgi:hypothetical protein
VSPSVRRGAAPTWARGFQGFTRLTRSGNSGTSPPTFAFAAIRVAGNALLSHRDCEKNVVCTNWGNVRPGRSRAEVESLLGPGIKEPDLDQVWDEWDQQAQRAGAEYWLRYHPGLAAACGVGIAKGVVVWNDCWSPA